MTSVERVSVHGGHSGQFCNHATNSLEEIIKAYIALGFTWVGITEHAPAISEELLYPDQKAAGLTPEILLEQFGQYMQECRRLQRKYVADIRVFAAMEIETYSGYETFVPYLIETFSPDYIVGSVHFVKDIGFDYSREQYEQAKESAGGIDALYLAYFDLQYEMIRLLRPAVVGHFDLVRLFDPDYRERLVQPDIAQRVKRNLELISELDLIMDFNLRALAKGAAEPYITHSILEMAREYDITIVPGDDSHGITSVGNFFDEGSVILQKYGFSSNWRRPI